MKMQKDKQFTFEDPTPTTNKTTSSSTTDTSSSSLAPSNEPWTQEWVETIERSIELARSQQYLTNGSSSVESYLPLASRSYSSLGPDGTGNLDLDLDELTLTGGGGDPGINGAVNGVDGAGGDLGGPSTVNQSKSRRKFSKRQSKNGLTAVF